jgi:hypothetical protein
MKWINAIGLILQFFSFWLAAPELLGRQTLERFELQLRKLVASLPVIIIGMITVGYGLTFGIAGVMRGLEASEKGITEEEMNRFFIIMGVFTFLYFLFILFYKKIRAWMEVKFAAPLTEALIRNNESRKNALVAGAVLFTVGFLIQLVVILIS